MTDLFTDLEVRSCLSMVLNSLNVSEKGEILPNQRGKVSNTIENQTCFDSSDYMYFEKTVTDFLREKDEVDGNIEKSLSLNDWNDIVAEITSDNYYGLLTATTKVYHILSYFQRNSNGSENHSDNNLDILISFCSKSIDLLMEIIKYLLQSPILRSGIQIQSTVDSKEIDVSMKEMKNHNINYVAINCIGMLSLRAMMLTISSLLDMLHSIYRKESKKKANIKSNSPNHFISDLYAVIWILCSFSTNLRPEYEISSFESLLPMEIVWLTRNHIPVPTDNRITLFDCSLLSYYSSKSEYDIKSLIVGNNKYNMFSKYVTKDVPDYNLLNRPVWAFSSSSCQLIQRSFDSTYSIISDFDTHFSNSSNIISIEDRDNNDPVQNVSSAHILLKAYNQMLHYYHYILHANFNLHSSALAVIFPMAMVLVEDYNSSSQQLGIETLLTLVRYTSSATMQSMLAWLIPKLYHTLESLPPDTLGCYAIVCRILSAIMSTAQDSSLSLLYNHKIIELISNHITIRVKASQRLILLQGLSEVLGLLHSTTIIECHLSDHVLPAILSCLGSCWNISVQEMAVKILLFLMKRLNQDVFKDCLVSINCEMIRVKIFYGQSLNQSNNSFVPTTDATHLLAWIECFIVHSKQFDQSHSYESILNELIE